MSSVWSRIVAGSSLLVLLGFGAGRITAQTTHQDISPKHNSPYSAYGLGDIVDQYFVAAGGMGGLSAAFRDPFHLNMRNPASLAFLEATAFELGFNAKYSLLKGGGQTDQLWSGNLDYMAIGFPLSSPINQALENRRRPLGYGMAFSLQPYTEIGYDVLVRQDGNGGGATASSFKGAGGTYRIVWGNSVRWTNLSAGVNLSYLFGKMTRSQQAAFSELPASYISVFNDEISVSGFLWEFGLQYTLEFKEVNDKNEREASGKRLVFGAFGNANNDFKTNTSRLITRESFEFRDIDTISFSSDLKQKGRLPIQFNAGVVYEDVNRLRLGVEFQTGQWSEYFNEAKPEELADTRGFAFGAEYIPDYASYNNFFERVRYRLGGFYRTDPRTFEAGQLQQYALTLGLGLPIVRPREQVSFINFALEVGRFGQEDLLQETYFKMSLGFTLNDNTWFFQRKFN